MSGKLDRTGDSVLASSIYGKKHDNLVYVLEVDDVDSFLIIDRLIHHKVHEGKLFFVCDLDTDVDTGDIQKYWLLFTGETDSRRIHMASEVSASNSGLFQLSESPIVTSQGTPLTVRNYYLESNNTTLVTFFKDCTVSNEGTLLCSNFIGSSHPSSKIGGEVRTDTEIIFKKNTYYLYKFIPDSDNTRVNIHCEWYEG